MWGTYEQSSFVCSFGVSISNIIFLIKWNSFYFHEIHQNPSPQSISHNDMIGSSRPSSANHKHDNECGWFELGRHWYSE